MDSAYFINGDDKVNYLVDGQTSDHSHNHSAAANRRKTAVLSIFLILLALAVVAAFTSISTTNKPPSSTLAAPSLSAESIQTVCSVTQSPNSCITTISSLNNPPKPDQELLFIISLYVSLAEVKNISSLPEALISESNDPKTVSALRDCEFLFDDAVSQLNESINSVSQGERVFTRRKIRELNSWISAAMTDEETCLDGLEEMGSAVVDEVRMRVQKSNKCMSNSLAILARIQPLQNVWT